jgi:tRNA pseudouridine38-40 synthase
MSDKRQQRIKIRVEYDGTDFVGWQLQSNGRSVQGEIELALTKIFHQNIRVHGAGRTDAGVHASGQMAHFDALTNLDAHKIQRALNAKLPFDVSIRQAECVNQDFHARFSAASRSYTYTISHERVSLARHEQWILFARVKHPLIHAAVAQLRGTHDFTSFSKYVPEQIHHYCHVFEAEWEEGETFSRLHIRANRFLQGMVRCIVGGLVLVGRGRYTLDDFTSILEEKDRARSPMLAPPNGLVLTDVGYDLADRQTIDRIKERLRLVG